MKSLLVRIFGFPATIIHGDTLVLDRWLWLKKHVPCIPSGSKRLPDVGCGTGVFTIGSARRGYRALGLSWDERNNRVAQQRAAICKASLAEFEVRDVRQLDQLPALQNRFDVVVCCENIEHILNDHKLIVDMGRCLKSGGTLLLTTPNFNYRPMNQYDNGPFSNIEDGGHVRKGYTPEGLKALCSSAGLKVQEIGYCCGFVSQKATAFMRAIDDKLHPFIVWGLSLPLRVLPPFCDPWISKIASWPGYSITLVATKVGNCDPQNGHQSLPRNEGSTTNLSAASA